MPPLDPQEASGIITGSEQILKKYAKKASLTAEDIICWQWETSRPVGSGRRHGDCAHLLASASMYRKIVSSRRGHERPSIADAVQRSPTPPIGKAAAAAFQFE